MDYGVLEGKEGSGSDWICLVIVSITWGEKQSHLKMCVYINDTK